jgi:hypothetical protein
MMKSLINKYILIFIGSFIVIYFLYIRIILERVPKDFTKLSLKIYLAVSLCMSVFFTILLILSIYRYLKSSLITKKSHIENNIFYKYYSKNKDLLSSIIQLITKSLITFDSYLKYSIPFSGNTIEYIGRFLITTQLSSEIINKIIIFIRLVIAVTFIIELVFYKKIDLFYKLLILLVIPLIHTYIIYSLKLWIDDQVKSIDYVLEFEMLNYNNKIVPFTVLVEFYCHENYYDGEDIRIKFIFKKKYLEYWQTTGKNIKYEKNYAIVFSYLVCQIAFHLFCYDRYLEKSKLNSIFSIITLSIYSISWIYISFYLLTK